jgi:hypothetical protein
MKTRLRVSFDVSFDAKSQSLQTERVLHMSSCTCWKYWLCVPVDTGTWSLHTLFCRWPVVRVGTVFRPEDSNPSDYITYTDHISGSFCSKYPSCTDEQTCRSTNILTVSICLSIGDSLLSSTVSYPHPLSHPPLAVAEVSVQSSSSVKFLRTRWSLPDRSRYSPFLIQWGRGLLGWTSPSLWNTVTVKWY